MTLSYCSSREIRNKIGREQYLGWLLFSLSDKSNDKGSLPQHAHKGEPRMETHVLRLLAKPCNFLLIQLTACVLSF